LLTTLARYPEGHVTEAVLLDVGRSSLEILIPEFGLEEKLHLVDLGVTATIQHDTLLLGKSKQPVRRFETFKV